MLNARFLILLGLCWIWLAAVSNLQAQISTGTMNWETDSKGTLSEMKHGLPTILEITAELIMTAEAGQPPAKKPSAKKGDAPAGKDLRSENYTSDLQYSMIGMDEKRAVAFMMQRSLKAYRGEVEGMRALDILSGENEEHEVVITYRTEFDAKSGIRVSQVSSPRGKNGALAMLVAPKAEEQPAIILLMGGLDADWARTIDAGEDYVEWAYTGRIRAKASFCLLHMVTVCPNSKPATVKKAVEALIVKGMPLDSNLPETIQGHLVNFPVTVREEAGEPAVADEAEPEPTGKLDLLEKWLESLGVKRPAGTDVLQLESGVRVQGDFAAKDLKLEGQALKPEDVAAIIRGTGTRESRVFMRDGSVRRGRLEWQSAKFESKDLGAITLKADSPGVILLRQGKTDGFMAAKPVAWMADALDGQVLPVTSLPGTPLGFRWLGGGMQVPWKDVVSLRALPPPALEHELVLKDGSRLRGWLENEASFDTPVTAWALTLPSLMALMEPVPKVPPPESFPALILRDGSVIVGELANAVVPWRAQSEEMEIKVADLQSIKRLSRDDEDVAVLFGLIMKNGTKLSGYPRDQALVWKHGSQTLNLSWQWVQDIQFAP